MQQSRSIICTLILAALILSWLGGCASSKDPGAAARDNYRGRFVSEKPSAGRATPDSLIVVAYNIEYALQSHEAVDQFLADERLKRVDVLLLQEMDPAGTDLIARRLGMDYVYAPGYVHPKHDRLYGTAVLSRWPIQSSQGLVLPHPNPFSSNHRRAAAADIAIGEKLLRVVSVHLSTLVIPLPDRLHQIEVLCDSLAVFDEGPDRPVIIGGDFNSVTASEAVEMRQTMRKARFRQVRLPKGATAKSRPVDLINYDLVLDHFFYRGLVAGHSGVAYDFTASDHYPIWSVFYWNR